MLVIGHRGASRAEKENTPAAFRRAAEMGADGVELDVRLAADGRLVVCHDALPADPLAVDRLCSFGEVLDACGSMLVNVEIKNNETEADFDPSMAVVEPVLAELASRGDPERWLISSFSLATIDRCHAVDPQFATALLVLGAKERLLDKIVDSGHSALHPHVDAVDPELVDRCVERGLAVNTWTCNDAARIRELEAIGVHGVCTDVPDEALAALDRVADGSAVSPVRWERPT